MSTAVLPPPAAVRAGVRLLTAADVAALPDQLPSGPVKYELHEGELRVMPPPGAAHGRRQARFASRLLTHGEEQGHGEAFAEVGVLLSRNPDTLRGPDAAFLTTAQLPPVLSPEGYLLTVPALIVEVRSKNDSQPEIDAKVNEYLTAGAVLVWVADPDARAVTAYQANQPPAVFAAADVLTAGPVIPGFAVPVADLLPA